VRDIQVRGRLKGVPKVLKRSPESGKRPAHREGQGRIENGGKGRFWESWRGSSGGKGGERETKRHKEKCFGMGFWEVYETNSG